MPPGGGGRLGEHGWTKQQDPLAIGRRDEDTPPHPTPPTFPAIALVSSQKKRRKRRKKKKKQAAASIPEGPLVEILSRVPYRSLCRFKCVSKQWLALCSDPDIRKRSPQTLSGFFHNPGMIYDKPRFRNLSRRSGPAPVDPSLTFLCGYQGVMVEQCCGGLLLCKCFESWDDYGDEYDLVVCNPATEKWTVLPPMNISRRQNPIHFFLGFDMAVTSRFVVLVPLRGCLDDVAIYLSETGRWTRTGWDDRAVPVVTAEGVFLNGFMHLMTYEPFIVAVDTEGKECRKIALPEGMEPSYSNTSMGQSQGLLHAWYIDPDEDFQLSVWVLEDYGSDKWILKHTVNLMDLFDEKCTSGLYEMFAIHPERNLIFITDGQVITLSYNMDNQEVHVMCISQEFLGGLPYIPCFGEWISDGH